MSAQPYTEAEVGAWRAYVAACASGVEIPTHERAGIRALFRLSLPSDYYARWLATVDALQARLAAADGLLREAREQIVYLHDKFTSTGTGNAALARIDAHLAAAPAPGPEGGEVARA